jgi:hypothetical protein
MCSSLLASVVGVLEFQTEAYSSLDLTRVKLNGQFREGKEKGHAAN